MEGRDRTEGNWPDDLLRAVAPRRLSQKQCILDALIRARRSDPSAWLSLDQVEAAVREGLAKKSRAKGLAIGDRPDLVEVGNILESIDNLRKEVRRWAERNGAEVRIEADPARGWRLSAGQVPLRRGDRKGRPVIAWIAAAAIVLAAALILVWYRRATHPSEISTVELSGDEVEAISPRGEMLWRRPLNAVFAPLGIDAHWEVQGSQPELSWVGNLAPGGGKEILVLAGRVAMPRAASDLAALDARGATLWVRHLGRPVEYGGITLPDAYAGAILGVQDALGDGLRQILVKLYQCDRGVNRVLLLDAGGDPLWEYWNAGNLDAHARMEVDADGREEILLAGLHNGYREGVLAALDPVTMRERRIGSSPEGADMDPTWRSAELPGRGADVYLRFRRSLIAGGFGYHMVQELRRSGRLVEATVLEPVEDRKAPNGVAHPGAPVIYYLGPGLRVERVVPGDEFRSLYEEARESRPDLPTLEEQLRLLSRPLYWDGRTWSEEPSRAGL